MYCKNCGKQIPDGVKFCGECGAQQTDSYTTYTGYTSYTQNREPKPSVGFIEAIKLFFTHYADFNGRSRRSEYWWAFLFQCLASAVAGIILQDYSTLWSLAVLIPNIAISVRRLHDIGKAGTWYLLNLIPVVGQIILIVWYCKDSAPENQWGPNPKF